MRKTDNIQRVYSPFEGIYLSFGAQSIFVVQGRSNLGLEKKENEEEEERIGEEEEEEEGQASERVAFESFLFRHSLTHTHAPEAEAEAGSANRRIARLLRWAAPSI